MAATDATPLPLKNQAFRITFPMWLTTGLINSGAAGLDSEVSIDGATFADCTSEATEIATSSGTYYLDLTAAEMNGDTIAVQVKSSTTNAITYKATIYPSSSGKMKVDIQTIAGTAQTARDIGASVLLSSGTGTGQVSLSSGTVTAGAISANAITASALATDAVSEIATAVDTTLTASHGSGSWASGGSGSGAYTITVTVTDGTDPLQNAIVRVVEGVSSYTVTTNASGQGAFALDAATYSVAVTKDGYQFTPTTRTVTGNEAGTLTNDLELTETVIPAPDSPELCTVSMYCVDASGTAVSGLAVTFTLYPEQASRADGNVITTRTKTATSNGSGIIQTSLIRTDGITQQGAYYKMTVSGASKVPAQPIYLTSATFDLGTLIA